MLITPDANTYSLLQYWHQGLWRSIFNRLPLSSGECQHFHSVSQSETATGRLSISFCSTSVPVWIAPLVLENKQDPSQCWIPLWLPAVIEGQAIKIRKEVVLPWIPASQFNETKSYSPFSEPLHLYDDWLQNECLTEEGLLSWQAWQVFYQASIGLLDKLSEGAWQANLTHRGFVLTENAIIATEDQLFRLKPELTHHLSQQLTNKQVSPLLMQFAAIEDSQPQSVFDTQQLVTNANKLCGAISETPISELTYTAAIHALAMPNGEFLAIKAPIGAQKAVLLNTIVASMVVEDLIAHQRFPEIYLLTPSKVLPQVALPSSSKSAVTLETLQLAYQNLQLGISLAQQFYQSLHHHDLELTEDQNLDQYIGILQARDEKSEYALNKALQDQTAARDKIRHRPMLTRMLKWVFKRKATRLALDEIEKACSDKIRKIKVKRAKIHRTLIKAIDAANTTKNLQRQWENWFIEQGIDELAISQNITTDLRSIQNHLAKKLFALADQYWQSSADLCTARVEFPLAGWSLLKLSEKLHWAPTHIPTQLPLLIIDEANRLHPQEIAPLLALSQRALLLGDNQDLPTIPVLSPFVEETELTHYQLAEEDLIEQLHYKGLLLSAGNAFTAALTNNSRQQYEYGTYASSLKIENSPIPAIGIVQVLGKSEPVAANKINSLEAMELVKWLNSGPLAQKQHDILVLTPFQAQKELIAQYFQNHNIVIQIALFDELEAKEWEYIIFSPVYTVGDRRPFLFDQGEWNLYSALARAKKGFWIIGDRRIFDSKMHSPSGKIAKLLSGTEDHLVSSKS